MDHFEASNLDSENVARLLATDLVHGLTSFEARERLKKFGRNSLVDIQSRKSVPVFIYKKLPLFFKQLSNPMIQLLIICIIISACIGDIESAVSVAIAILIVCIISFIQSIKANQSLGKVTNNIPNLCKVIREDRTQEIESDLLVPGDIIILLEGQRVPADVRLFDVHSLTIDESNLTGETQSRTKSTALESSKILKKSFMSISGDEKDTIAKNLALMGTTIESGHGKGIVVGTGKCTRFGEVYDVLNNIVHPKSPLQVNIDRLSLHLVIFACVITAGVSIVGIVQQKDTLEVIYYAISLAVTAIPEGLPVAVSLIMALAVMRLSKQNTIVKSMNSIETSGCIQVLCADKTGTLTRNDMTLTDIVTSELHSLSSTELKELNDEDSRKHLTFNNFGGKMYAIGRLMEVGTLCNNATYGPYELDSTGSHYIGQATECAILNAAIRLGFGDSRNKFDRLHEVPFSSNTRRMEVKCQRTDLAGSSPMYYIKGAWENILQDCTQYYENGLVKPKTNEMWLEYARICTCLGAQGLRVLGLATGQSLDQLTFVGIIGINNALRDGISETIKKLKSDLHVDVKMITGDSKATAIAVGKTLGLIDDIPEECDLENRHVMSGEQLKKLINSDLDDMVIASEINSKSIFYRVDPLQKSLIVGKIQSIEKVVAMIGDGVNDVVGLKKANLSIAMGAGADICKEIADLVISDNELNVLSQAVIEGRGIFANIQSFLSYQISICGALIVLIAVSFVIGGQTPFTTVQLLFLNLLADGPLAQSLCMERVGIVDLQPAPRNVTDHLLNLRVLSIIFKLTAFLTFSNGLLYYHLADDGHLDSHDKSLMFTCFVFTSVFAAIGLRSKVQSIFEIDLCGNKGIFYCCLTVLMTQVCIVQIDPINRIFEVDPIEYLEFVYLFFYSAMVLLAMDACKIICRVCRPSNLKRIIDHFRTRELKLVS